MLAVRSAAIRPERDRLQLCSLVCAAFMHAAAAASMGGGERRRQHYPLNTYACQRRGGTCPLAIGSDTSVCGRRDSSRSALRHSGYLFPPLKPVASSMARLPEATASRVDVRPQRTSSAVVSRPGGWQQVPAVVFSDLPQAELVVSILPV